MQKCPFCGGELSNIVRKCRHCGEWLDGRPQPARREVHIHHRNDDDPTLAIVTLILYLFVYPAGFILNIVGLFTGPRRGCFVWMLVVFVLLPVVVALGLLLLMVFGAAVAPSSSIFTLL